MKPDLATEKVLPAASAATREYDVARVRAEFPVLHQRVHDRPLVYLDSAASSQKPSVVLDAMTALYERDYSNVHRGVHALSERSTTRFEATRERVRAFVNARESREIIFVRGTTEGINLVAASYARPRLERGDEVLVSVLEHHSNIVPWQLACEATGAALRVIPCDERGVLDLDAYAKLVTDRTRIVAISHVSNALGTVNPIGEMIAVAHARGAIVVVDGAQAAPHLPIDVRALDADFYTFSGHKVYGPTGAGVLYGKAGLLEAMPPYQSGGDMIRSVSFDGTLFNDLPWKFEAGTPDIAAVVGLGAALDFVARIGCAAIAAHEHELLLAATRRLAAIPGLRLVGTAPAKAAVVSFVLDDVHPHDIATVLDREGIAIRAGHHCAQPLMERLGVSATARASFACYNTLAEVEALGRAIEKCREVFGL
ncbi:MAG: cysteine desulfurase [Planctomycetota bacterium]